MGLSLLGLDCSFGPEDWAELRMRVGRVRFDQIDRGRSGALRLPRIASWRLRLRRSALALPSPHISESDRERAQLIRAKVESTPAMSSDRLSSLPSEIKGTILSKLNVLDAIRTSILSKAWRNVWTTSPGIILSDTYQHPIRTSISGFSEMTARFRFITLVDLAMLLHDGPLVLFSIQCARGYHDVFDRWMYMLSRKNPRSITIKFLTGTYYKIPSSIISLSDLEYLQIRRCMISLPQEFEGFKRLTVLNLKHFSSTDNGINNLISSCPCLNTLRLKRFEGINCLRIQAQTLQVLKVKGNFEDFHLHAPNLSDVYVTLDKTKVEGNRKYDPKHDLFSLTRIEALVIKRCILALPQGFEGFKRLSVLNLKCIFSTDNDINNLISSCPWLNKLRLKYFEGITCLRIHSQRLELLVVEGKFEEFHLHAPNLSHMYLGLDLGEAQQSDAVVGDKKNHLKQAFVSLTNLEELNINGSFLTYLSKGCLLTELPGVFDRLWKICIGECFWDWTEVLGVCSIFQNAPTFRELEIWSFSRPEEFWHKPIWDQDQTEIEEPTLHHLVTVTIYGFLGLTYQVSLVELLLRWSPALEELKIFRSDDEDSQSDEYMCKVLTKLLALPRAKVESTSAESSDRLSSLPLEIKAIILSKITSILSTAWRNVWTTSPGIILSDIYCFSGSSERTERSKFITLVDLALLLHDGPLVSFLIQCLRKYHDVFDRWMYMLLRKKPRSITIKFLSGRYYKIPSSLIYPGDLEYLQIRRCKIILPQEFEGFKRLTVLNLKHFSSTDNDLNNLISSCPSQALHVLKVKGIFEDFHLHAPNLSDVYVTLDNTKVVESRKYHLKQDFVSLTRIEALVIKRCILALPQVFEGFKQLSVLKLKHIFSTESDINNLISSCPWLNTLCLKYFEGISCLRIQSETLQFLEVDGEF
uniref:F-box domain-containing protein n=1 Tax=Leersia perrieri TaxID=77586 RepID=A0A0D9VGQ4_9ORYZ